MIGTLLNAAGILVGGVVGLAWRKGLSPARESMFKVLLGAFTVFYGLRLTWISLNGSSLQILKQLFIAMIALMIGKLTGQLLRLQKLSNRIGQIARKRLANIPEKPPSIGEGFKIFGGRAFDAGELVFVEGLVGEPDIAELDAA